MLVTTSKSEKKYTTQLSKDDLGHWVCKFNFNPSEAFGFLYCVQNNETNQFYWGKKQFFHLGKKKSVTYGKEMTWRTYTGSSVHLKADISKLGHDKFSFEIVDVYNTKGGLYYAEAYAQMVSESMTEYLEDNNTPRFYNRQIAAIRFVPKEAITDRTRKYIRSIKRKY
jgi:hypothetical protein